MTKKELRYIKCKIAKYDAMTQLAKLENNPNAEQYSAISAAIAELLQDLT